MTPTEPPYRPSIFIASSSKSFAIAQAVKINFEATADVEIWTENLFKVNTGTLQTLLNRASYYDFFIADFAADDRKIIDEKEKMVTRDNVIFEFGLFLGRIGLRRAYFVLEEGVDLFSDWDGITTARYSRGEDLVEELRGSCDLIRELMGDAPNHFNYTVLPSTSLAVGYYFNFLKPVLEALKEQESVEIQERNKKGEVINTFRQGLKNYHPTIEIRVPRKLYNLERDELNDQTREYKQLFLPTKVRPFPFYVQGQFGEQCDLHLFDIPTTLLASYHCIQEIVSKDFLLGEKILQRMMDREIDNFQRTLSQLIPDNDEKKYFSFTVY